MCVRPSLMRGLAFTGRPLRAGSECGRPPLPLQKKSFSFFTPTRCCHPAGRGRSAKRSPRAPSAAPSAFRSPAAARACAGSPSGRTPERLSRACPTATRLRSCGATYTRGSQGIGPGRSSTTGTYRVAFATQDPLSSFGTPSRPLRAATSNAASPVPFSTTGGPFGVFVAGRARRSSRSSTGAEPTRR